MKKKIVVIVLSLFLLTFLFTGCSSEATTDEEQVKIVASTSWTAAMAEAAGGENVTVLAPVELRHPPEYDFKPSDVVALIEADWIIMAGYEPFMNKMLETNDIDPERVIQVTTTNTYDSMVEQTRAIAEKMGTQDRQQVWEERFTEFIDIVMANAEENDVSSTRVLVHQHLQAFIRSLGFDVLDVFSADEMSPARIGELAAKEPDLIIDNFHNPQGITIAETVDVPLVELKNFPGPEHKGLIELFLDNATKLGIYE